VELHNRTWMDSSKQFSEENGFDYYYDFDTEWPLGGSGRNGFLYYEYQDLIKYIGYDLVYYIEEYFTLKGNEFCQIAGYDHEEEQGDTPPAFYIYRVDENGERIEGEHNLTYDDATNESKQFEGEGDPVDFSGWYETNCLTYQSKQEMIDYLESWSNGGGMAMASSTGDWKSAYRQCLNDLLSEKTGIDYGQDGFFGADLDNAYFTLQDITDDGIPELLINPEDYFWAAYTINNGSCERMFWSSFVTFYDSDQKLIYVEGYSEEMEKSYTVYTPEDAKNNERTYGYYEEYEPEDPANPYFYYDGEQINIISKQEWDAFKKTYNADMKKYGFKKEWKLTPENIEKYLQ
nr:hypothetical protein [Lachnospiraceae bacterium]